MREIGERAGVDAALIARYFGSKADLYIAAVAAERMGDRHTPEYQGLEEMVDSLLDRVDRDGPGPILQALVRSDTADEIRAAAQARLARRLVEPLVAGMEERGPTGPVSGPSWRCPRSSGWCSADRWAGSRRWRRHRAGRSPTCASAPSAP